MSGPAALRTVVGTLEFQNPIVLASGTAGYGQELDGVIDLSRVGGFVTKAVSVAPRAGNPAPRVAEFEGGMINAVGLANPGLDAVCRDHLPWMASHFPATRKLVNVVGFAIDEYPAVVEGIEEALARGSVGAVDGYELNVSCPNTKAGGEEFGANAASLREVVSRARRATSRPIAVKLAPTLPNIGEAARISADCGADLITVVNTIPGLVIDVERRRPVLGYGSGGLSGPAILPVGVLATWKVRKAVSLPIIGLGGVSSGTDAVQYIVAGASLVGIGTAALRDPRAPERIVRELDTWCRNHDVRHIQELTGTLEWPT